MLRDVYIQGFHDGESNAMRNLQRESDRINKSRITWQDNMVEYKKPIPVKDQIMNIISGITKR